jgi:hypothetical protein
MSWVDLEDAHRRLDRAEGALRHGDPRATTGDATVAASILRRPLLAVTIAESAVQLDPFRETGHRLLVEAESARGDRGAALRAFNRCEQLLADELGVRPSPETMAILERVSATADPGLSRNRSPR